MEIRRSYDRLISTMGYPILVRWHLYIESGTRCSVQEESLYHSCWCPGSLGHHAISSHGIDKVGYTVPRYFFSRGWMSPNCDLRILLGKGQYCGIISMSWCHHFLPIYTKYIIVATIARNSKSSMTPPMTREALLSRDFWCRCLPRRFRLGRGFSNSGWTSS